MEIKKHFTCIIMSFVVQQIVINIIGGEREILGIIPFWDGWNERSMACMIRFSWEPKTNYGCSYVGLAQAPNILSLY